MARVLTASNSEIQIAAAALQNGHLVAFHTETVYGLGADPFNKDAVDRIYKVKNRPRENPLIVHIKEISQLENWATDIPEYAYILAQKFWPGPMTLVLRKNRATPDWVTGGQDTVAIRIPKSKVALELLDEFYKLGGAGIVAPSANIFTHVSPTNYRHVLDDLEDRLSSFDIVLDGGGCEIGIESTIISCLESKPRIMRSGLVSESMVASLLSKTYFLETSNHSFRSKVVVPGYYIKHYSPRASVKISKTPQAGDGYIALKNELTPEGVVRLASPASSKEFAQVLYSAMRKADELQLSQITIYPPDGTGIEKAILDRIIKASGLC